MDNSNLKNTRPSSPREHHPKSVIKYLVLVSCESNGCVPGSSAAAELIQLPAVLLDIEKLAVTGRFQQYCRPSLHKKLSVFCKELTGISQRTVDQASSFKEVLDLFKRWLQYNGLFGKTNWSLVTMGHNFPRDLFETCRLNGFQFPDYAKLYVDLAVIYNRFADSPSDVQYDLSAMLSDLGMKFQGRLTGIDKADNMARVCLCLIRTTGVVLRPTDRVVLFEKDETGEASEPDSGESGVLPQLPWVSETITSKEWRKMQQVMRN